MRAIAFATALLLALPAFSTIARAQDEEEPGGPDTAKKPAAAQEAEPLKPTETKPADQKKPTAKTKGPFPRIADEEETPQQD